MKLQIIFLSDLVEHSSNRIKENYLKGKRDKFSLSQFYWPIINTDKKATKVWCSFLSLITNQEGILLSLLNTSTLISVHIILNTEISNNYKYLRIISKNECLYFELKCL